MSQIKRDFSGALRKTAVLKRLPKATKHVISQWATDTVTILKRRAAGMQKSGRGRKTGQLARNIGMVVSIGEEKYSGTIGTGVGRTQSVKYASIQDEGGTITAKGKKLTIPLGNTKGVIKNYPGGFFFKSSKGNVLYAKRVGKRGKLKPLFVLKDSVTIPASNWFSGIISTRTKDLSYLMRPENVLKVADGMAKGEGI